MSRLSDSIKDIQKKLGQKPSPRDVERALIEAARAGLTAAEQHVAKRAQFYPRKDPRSQPFQQAIESIRSEAQGLTVRPVKPNFDNVKPTGTVIDVTAHRADQAAA